ncbi:MAG: diguanylate cyclase [Comamonadaceae bacterium]|nr:diguanylate cyclase [Comamonadaceae bacterium]
MARDAVASHAGASIGGFARRAPPPMTPTPRTLQPVLLLAATALVALFAAVAPPKPLAGWQWVDIAAEGGGAAMVGVWAWVVLGSPSRRPRHAVAGRRSGRADAGRAGRHARRAVRRRGGVAAAGLDRVLVRGGRDAGADARAAALAPGAGGPGRAVAAARARLPRPPRLRPRDAARRRRLPAPADRTRARRRGRPCAVAMLDIARWDAIERGHGRAEADRALQAVAQQLLLNLPPHELLCRYAGARFVLLMPGADLGAGTGRAQHLVAMVEAMRWHPRDAVQPLALTLRSVVGIDAGDAQALLTRLSRELEAADAAAAELSLRTAGR